MPRIFIPSLVPLIGEVEAFDCSDARIYLWIRLLIFLFTITITTLSSIGAIIVTHDDFAEDYAVHTLAHEPYQLDIAEQSSSISDYFDVPASTACQLSLVRDIEISGNRCIKITLLEPFLFVILIPPFGSLYQRCRHARSLAWDERISIAYRFITVPRSI